MTRTGSVPVPRRSLSETDSSIVAPHDTSVLVIAARPLEPFAASTASYASTRPAPNSLSLPAGPRSTAVCCRIDLISSGASPGSAESISATAPATCGVAIDVPDICAYPEQRALLIVASPGADTSGLTSPGGHGKSLNGETSCQVTGPRELNPAIASAHVVAPTPMSRGTSPGVRTLSGSFPDPSLPAATTIVVPASMAFSTLVRHVARSGFSSCGHPRLIEITAAPCSTAYCIAAQTCASSVNSTPTFSVITVAPGATPMCRPEVPSPATEPAVCEPCPWSSLGSLSA